MIQAQERTGGPETERSLEGPLQNPEVLDSRGLEGGGLLLTKEGE